LLSYCCRIFRFGLGDSKCRFWNGFSNNAVFEQWGSTLAVVAGVCWFGLLFCWYYFFISYGTPWMGFMRDEFGWSKIKELGLWSNDFSFRFTNSYFFKEGVFDEYDYGRER
jgi:hypothetical protein